MKSEKAKPKTKEIPAWSWYAVIGYMMLVGLLFPPEIKGFAFAAGWFAVGGICVSNYRGCRRLHCAITGPGFLAIGIASLLDAFAIINLSSWMIWGAFGAVMAVGFGLEYLYRRKFGSPYRITTIGRL